MVNANVIFIIFKGKLLSNFYSIPLILILLDFLDHLKSLLAEANSISILNFFQEMDMENLSGNNWHSKSPSIMRNGENGACTI